MRITAGYGGYALLWAELHFAGTVHGAFVRDQEVHAVVQDWKGVVAHSMLMASPPTVKAKVAGRFRWR